MLPSWSKLPFFSLSIHSMQLIEVLHVDALPFRYGFQMFQDFGENFMFVDALRKEKKIQMKFSPLNCGRVELTTIVSSVCIGSPWMASNELAAATPSRSSSMIRMRASVPCCAKCMPSNEYQYSNSRAELTASQILIWSSINCSFAVLRQAPFEL